MNWLGIYWNNDLLKKQFIKMFYDYYVVMMSYNGAMLELKACLKVDDVLQKLL